MSTDGLGINLGLGLVQPIPGNLATKPSHFNLGLGLPALRWPYTTRHQSLTYDSSPTPSSSSDGESSSDSEFSISARRASGSATHDVLLSYLSPGLEEETERGRGRKVYLLSSGLKDPKRDWPRSKSETFKFPLPPGKMAPLKSALRSTSKTFSTSPVLRNVSGGVWRGGSRSWATLSPPVEEVEARQGWSPYSSVAPTPRQASGQHRFSLSSPDTQPPPYEKTEYSSGSSTSSRTLVSDSEEDSGAETDPNFSSDAAKLARLHASLLLLDRGVSELPLSLGEKKVEELGGSVEEKMAYLCGLGYRYRRTASNRHARKGSGDFACAQEQKAEVGGWWSDDEKQGQVQSYAPVVGKGVRVVSNAASAVSSGQCSPILTGMLAGTAEEEQGDGEGDETIRPHFLPPVAVDGLLGEEFAYLVDQDFTDDDAEQPDRKVYSAESGLMTPPLTTPELGLDGASPMFLDKWPSPLPASRKTMQQKIKAVDVDGCKPSVSTVAARAVNLDGCKSLPAQTMTSSVSCPVSMLHHPPTTDEADDEEAHISHATRTTISPISVLTRPRPLRSHTSNSSLFSSASSDLLQRPQVTPSVLTRPRPVARTVDSGSFANRSTIQPAKTTQTAKRTRLGFTLPKSASTSMVQQVKVPQRKSSLDVRAEAAKHQQANDKLVHPNSVSRDAKLQEKFHSSASAYLQPRPMEQVCTDAASAAKHRRRGEKAAEGGMTKSISLPVLFTARTASQRARREGGHRRGRKSVVTAGLTLEDGGRYRVEPPKQGVLVVSETVVGLAL